MRLKIGIVFILASIHAYADNLSGIQVNWGYSGDTGPLYWGRLSKEFSACQEGKLQSPISIHNKTKTLSHSLAIDYQAIPLHIIDDGTTQLTIGNERYVINDGHTIQVNYGDKERELITFNQKTYILKQFHVHMPSENKLKGKSYPVEFHFVHQGEDGAIAVIGVFAEYGETNTVMGKILKHLPKTRHKELTFISEVINPESLLPKERDYYYFMGSLTTPPCTEGLNWLVMKNPITLSPDQMATLKNAMHGRNARPVMTLNNREITYSTASKA